MNMHQHIAEAERIIAAAKSEDVANQEGFTGWGRETLIALAQAHASLAEVMKNAPSDMSALFNRGRRLT